MAPDRDTSVPDDGSSVSVVETAFGTVVRTQAMAGSVAAVRLRRVALRQHRESLVLLDLRATRAAAPVAVTAVADLAAAVRARGGDLRVVRSPHTPQAIVGAARAPVHATLAEALGCRSRTPRAVDPPTRPSDRLPPATDGRGGMDPAGPPLTPGAPVRIHPASLDLPHPRPPEQD
ncbi:hypothetical protein [Actinomycetospora sp. TBRC 11914]|uniref:hypothetical protein n=1 Tax=Actinomycetospora sp. TBRC 11914 TaxID=2729387 RepID=UPI00145E2BB9|nr:hypothetical protein [Actinomycetospora sp. TBRC 11914]NMO88327.1 hypothetical protein [Actinomycetospora sp. TBRC 11914]